MSGRRDTARSLRQRLRLLAEAGRVLAASLDLEATLDNVARLVVPSLADWCAIDLVGPKGETLERTILHHRDPSRAAEGEELRRRYSRDPRSSHGPEAVLREGRPRLFSDIPDALLEEVARGPEHLAALRALGMRSALLVPLTARDRILGVLTLVSDQEGRRYGAEDLSLAEELGRRCGVAVDNARLYREAQEARRGRDEALERSRLAAEHVGLLLDASRVLSSSHDPEAAPDAILDLARGRVAADAYALWRADPARRLWTIASAHGLSAGYRGDVIPFEGAPTLPDDALVVEDVERAPLLEARRGLYRAEGVRSLLVIPLADGSGGLGSLTFYYRRPRRFSEEEVAVARALANLASAALAAADLHAEQRRSRAELSETEQRYRELVHGVDAIVWEADATTWCFTFVSDQAERILGYPTARWLDGSDFWIQLIHPEDRERAVAFCSEQSRRKDEFEFRYRAVARDGRIVWLHDAVHVVRDAEGRALRLRGILLDITERVRLEDALQERAAELLEADRRKDEFLAMLGHELRNPLAPVANALEVLRLHPAPAVAERARAIAERQVAQMARLLDDLLDVSRITRGKIRVERRPVRLQDVVRAALEAAQSQLAARSHTIEEALAGEDLWTAGDPVRLEQVVANLLSNAARYTPHGGRITVRLERSGEGVAELEVRDEGVGIPAEALGSIFEPFAQLARAVEDGTPSAGLGIGLTLVRELVRLHGGSVEARSEGADRGSSFVVRLPLAAAGATGVEAARPRAPRTRRVLLVDDNEDLTETLAAALRLAGHSVERVADGASALAAVGAFEPEVVVLDIGLPDMSGYEVARQLRAAGAASPLLIGLSGFGGADRRERARQAGFDHYLLKPATFAALASLLDAAPPPPQILG